MAGTTSNNRRQAPGRSPQRMPNMTGSGEPTKIRVGGGRASGGVSIRTPDPGNPTGIAPSGR